jgi:hypothetical protein
MAEQTERQRALAAFRPMPAPPSYYYMDDDGAAKYLGFKGGTRRLKDLRGRGGGPKWIRIGTAVRYRSDWLDAWAEENAVASTSEELARRRV